MMDKFTVVLICQAILIIVNISTIFFLVSLKAQIQRIEMHIESSNVAFDAWGKSFKDYGESMNRFSYILENLTKEVVENKKTNHADHDTLKREIFQMKAIVSSLGEKK